MNRSTYTVLSATIAFLFVSVFFSCKKKGELPPVTPYNVGNTITIQQLRDLFLSNGCNTYKFTKDVSLYATVTMDASSGNIYKMVYLKDNTGAISMKQVSAGGLFVGDSLRINLNGALLDKASSGAFLQIDSVDVNSPQSQVVKLDVQKTVTPIVVTIPQLMNSVTTNSCSMAQSIYDGQLIQLNDVQFAANDTAQYYNNLTLPTGGPGAPSSISRNLTNCGALNSIGVYTSSYATEFLFTKTPSGSGSVIAIASFYSGVMQLTLRSRAEVGLTNPRCGVDTLTESFANCIASSNFATALPGWYNLYEVGYLSWQGGPPSSPPGYPIASNYNGQTRNVMWLISPPIQNSPTKNLNFQTAGNFGTTTHPRQLSVLISTDFNGTNIGGSTPLPSGQVKATWYDITSAFTGIQNGSISNYFFTDASAAAVVLSSIPSVSFLSSYTGKFYIGFRYTGHASTDSTQTVAIRNFVLKN